MVEHQIVRSDQALAVAGLIQRAQFASLEIESLDRPADVSGWRRAREIVSTPLREAESAAVIGNIERLIRPDGEAVGSAFHLLHQAGGTVGRQAAYLLRFDLHEEQ